MKTILISLISFFAIINVSLASQDFSVWPGIPSIVEDKLEDNLYEVKEFTAYVDIRYTTVYTCQEVGCPPSQNIFRLYLVVPEANSSATISVSTNIASYHLINDTHLAFNNVLMTTGHVVQVRGPVKYHDDGSAELLNVEQLSFLN